MNCTKLKHMGMIRGVIILIISMAVFSGICSINAAAESSRKVYDNGELLSEDEEQRLEKELERASAACGHDIIVYTVRSLEGYTVERRSERAADSINAGINGSGILYLVAIEDREYDIFTFGDMDRIMRSSDRDRLAGELAPYLSRGDYYSAFSKFGERARAAAEKGIVITFYPQALFIGAVVAFIAVLVMVSGMKTTRPEITAGNYTKSGSFRVTRSRDIYLYTSVSRVKIQSSSSGGHSGHRSGGHSSGKF